MKIPPIPYDYHFLRKEELIWICEKPADLSKEVCPRILISLQDQETYRKEKLIKTWDINRNEEIKIMFAKEVSPREWEANALENISSPIRLFVTSAYKWQGLAPSAPPVLACHGYVVARV